MVPDRHAEYRARAAECSELAAQTADPENKGSWLKLENSWRILAEQVEKRP